MKTCVASAAVLLAAASLTTCTAAAQPSPCDSVQDGYQCCSNITHSWGQYSPYFSVPSEIPATVPLGCQVTFVNVLSRHGARDPTASKTSAYRQLVARIHSSAKSYGPGYGFLQAYNYSLGADQLTAFGQQEMLNSGRKFFYRYFPLTAAAVPFFRASGENRVVVSAQNFSQGYHDARVVPVPTYPYPIQVIEEGGQSNNTLNHDLCTAFEDGGYSLVASAAQKKFLAVFAPPIQQRLSQNLPGVTFSNSDVVSFMDLCPFNTVASPTGAVSPFCNLFTETEWQQYGYYQSLNKWYGYGPGNGLGPSQGVGFVNELLARMTGNRDFVNRDETSVNHTLDASQSTFPLGPAHPLYADFSHDNDMTAIFSALGLYNQTAQLSNTTVQDTTATHGFSAAWTVPFASRAYFEKMRCAINPFEELVRVVINDRVWPLQGCDADSLGMCTLSKFVQSQTFARENGLWNQLCEIA